MTFHLAICLYGMFVACLTAVWLGWQSGVHLRWLDEWDAFVAEERFRLALRFQAHALEQDPTPDESQRRRSILRKQANARIAIRALQGRVADGR